MKKLMMMAVAATVLAAPAAMANQKDGMWFSKVDANADGKVTKSEHEKASAEKFAKLDLNGDGSVTKAEAAEAKAKWKAEHEAKGDKKAE